MIVATAACKPFAHHPRTTCAFKPNRTAVTTITSLKNRCVNATFNPSLSLLFDPPRVQPRQNRERGTRTFDTKKIPRFFNVFKIKQLLLCLEILTRI
jgi:hypothetical protein